MTNHVIPAEAVEAALIAFANAPLEPPTTLAQMSLNNQAQMTLALEAAAPHMLEQVERELTEAKRVIAMLVLEAGGKVSIGRRAIAELSDETIIETTQDVITGGWAIRAKVPGRS